MIKIRTYKTGEARVATDAAFDKLSADQQADVMVAAWQAIIARHDLNPLSAQMTWVQADIRRMERELSTKPPRPMADQAAG